MKLKTEMFNNKKYDIIDDVIIQTKTKNKIYSKKCTFNMMEGRFRIVASYKSRKMQNVSLFLPEYISQLYSYEPIIEENNLDYIKLVLTSSDLKYPLNLKNNIIELFDNGFAIRHDKIKVHPSYFFDKVVGLFFDLQ